MQWLKNVLNVTYNFNWGVIWTNMPMLYRGLALSFRVTVVTFAIGTTLGLIGALGRRSKCKAVSFVFSSYVQLIRNTPLLVQLFFIYFGLTSFRLFLSPNMAGIIALSVHTGGYLTEIIRAGIESVQRSQVEAGLSLGMSHFQTFRYVILFPAIKTVFPAYSNQFILTFLGSSVLSQISAEELTYYGYMIESRTFRSYEVFFAIAAIYFAVSQLLSLIMRIINKYGFTRYTV